MPATDIYYSALHYAKKAQAAAEDAADIRASLTNVFEFKGTVDSVSNLPAASADKTGWVYIVGTGEGNKTEYVCTGTAWEELGPALVMTDSSTSTKGVVQLATNAEVIEGTNTTKAVVPSAGAAAYGRLAGTNTWQGSNTFNGAVTIDNHDLTVDSGTVDFEQAETVLLPNSTTLANAAGTGENPIATTNSVVWFANYPDNKNFNDITDRGIYYTVHSQGNLNAPVEWTSGSIPWTVKVETVGNFVVQEASGPTEGSNKFPNVYKRRRMTDGTWQSWCLVQQNQEKVVRFPVYTSGASVTSMPYTATQDCIVYAGYIANVSGSGSVDFYIYKDGASIAYIGGLHLTNGDAQILPVFLKAGQQFHPQITGDVSLLRAHVFPLE